MPLFVLALKMGALDDTPPALISDEIFASPSEAGAVAASPECKTSLSPHLSAYLSRYLLLASHNQTDRTGVPAHLPCLRAKHQGVF